MKQQIKELVLLKIQQFQKKIQDISTFAIVRANNGMYGVKIYWRGKVKKGTVRTLDVDLTFDSAVATQALLVLEELMEEAKDIGLDMNQPIQSNKGW